MRTWTAYFLILFIGLTGVQSSSEAASFFDKSYRKEQQKKELETLQDRFGWWPTDAQPGAVKDDVKGGYWWYPNVPGAVQPWGNRGYIYVYKIIFDYKEEELPPPKVGELRPSLLIRKIIKNVKVYFDFDKNGLRDDARAILDDAVRTLGKNPEASVLVTGNTDQRGSEAYNEKLGKARAKAVSDYLTGQDISPERIRLVSRGKLDAVAHLDDLVGMQKDRNAQFVIAVVEEVMIPFQGPPAETGARMIDEGKYLVEEEKVLESEVRVSTRTYTVQKGDTLSEIAQAQVGSAHRWVYLYELNKDRIQDPDKLQAGQEILIPIE